MPSCSLESRASSQHMLLFWKRNSITLNILLSSSILFYCWACCCTVWNFPWETASKSLLPKCQFGSATPAMSLSNLLPSPSWEGGRVWREALDASAQALSSSSQEWSGTSRVLGTAGKHNSHGLLGKKINLVTPSQAEPVYHCNNLSVKGHALQCTSELFSAPFMLLLLKIEVIMKRAHDKLVS